MGVTKRISELIVSCFAQKAMNSQNEDKQVFSMVRFGNVLGSSGSVVPIFQKQIESGGPITVTDPNVSRYFMSLEEAAQLVLQASAMGTGGDVFVLDMGEPIKIVELAKRMIKLSGLKVKNENGEDGDIEIQITGLRPGEKLFEELLIGDDAKKTVHSKIMLAHERFINWSRLESALNELSYSLANSNIIEAKNIVANLVPEYDSTVEIVDLVYSSTMNSSS